MDLGALSPTDLPAVREGLESLLAQHRYVEALGECETARATFGEDAWLAGKHAYIHLRLGNSDLACNLSVEALNLGSDDPMVAHVLGAGHRNRGRHAQAAEALIVAHRLMPTRTDTAQMAVEEAVAAYGVEAAQAYFDEAYERLPSRGLAMVWAELKFSEGVHEAMPPGIVSGEILSVRAWLDRAGLAPAWVGPQEQVPVEAPPIFGEPDRDRFKAMVPGYVTYAASLPDATLFAKSGLILMPDGAVLNDTLADERFGRFMELPHDKRVIERSEARLLLDVQTDAVVEIDGGIMLSGWASDQFGHWVPEYLCRLAYMEHHPRFAKLPLIVDAGMPKQHLEYLRLIVPNPIVEIPEGGALRCHELVVASPSAFFPVHLAGDHQVPPENQGGISIDGARLIQARILERMPLPAVRDRKLYLSRKNRTWRRLLNEDEISAALVERGFEIVFPEDMSLEDQVAMYQSAKVVVAPNGSSLLNAIFAAKDTSVLVLSQRHLFNWATFYGFMREIGPELVFLCGPDGGDEKHADYAVPVKTVLEALEPRPGLTVRTFPPRQIPVARPRLPRLAALAPYIERIDEARWYSNFGPLCQEFEARLAERFGVDPSCICTIANATVGLSLALKAAGAKPGSLCIVPSWTFCASIHAVIDAGLVPFFVDVDESGVLTPNIVRDALARAPGEVGAVMPVAVCGQPLDIAAWDGFLIETGVPVVVDAAPGFDTARASGLLTVVSLHATKVLGIGEGGFVMSTDPALVREFRLRSNFGFQGTREALTAATNGKLSEYAAAVGLAALDEWDARRDAFQAAAGRYRENLRHAPGAALPAGWGESWISTTCVVRLDDPARTMPVLDSLHAASVETRAWWGRGMHTHRAFTAYPRLALPNTDHLAQTILGLPFYIDMSPEEIDTVCMALSKELAPCS